MKLKPCPFCGGKAVMFDFEGTVKKPYVVHCSKCGTESPKDSVSEQGAARIWNRRRPEMILENAIKWALGETGDFDQMPGKTRPYWWRIKLRELAGFNK